MKRLATIALMAAAALPFKASWYPAHSTHLPAHASFIIGPAPPIESQVVLEGKGQIVWTVGRSAGNFQAYVDSPVWHHVRIAGRVVVETTSTEGSHTSTNTWETWHGFDINVIGTDVPKADLYRFIAGLRYWR
jgi:hypothetical protein